MDKTDTFLTATMPQLRQAETALHNGDPGPRMAMWSHDDGVTLFGGVMGGSGWAEIEPIFQRLGASFSDCQSYDNEIIAARASDDLAYIVAYEHTTASIHGGPPPLTCCASPPCSTARAATGKWSTVTPTRRDHQPPANCSSNSRPAPTPRVGNRDTFHPNQTGAR